MKSIPAALQAHLNSRNTTLVTCWKVTRTDGKVFGFTEHDVDLVIDGVTYKAATGFTPSSVVASNNLAVDNLECLGVLDSVDIKEEDLLAGRWDGAKVEIFMVNWQDPSQGKVILPGWGWVGEVSVRRGRFVAEVRGLTQALQQTILELVSPLCRADLGDARCKVRLDPPPWQPNTSYSVRDSYAAETGSVVRPSSITGSGTFRHFKCVQAGTSGATEPAWNTAIGAQTTDGSVVWETIRALTVYGHVTAVVHRGEFEVSLESGDDPEGFFTFGLLSWQTGANQGLAKEVKQHFIVSGGVHALRLVEKMPYDVSVGDVFTVHAGCDKTLAACRDKFDNTWNRRAEDYVPGQDQIMRFGGQ